MPVDENAFFREATLRVCGSLDVDKALWRCFMFIRDYIPADRLCLNFFNIETLTTRVFASADPSGGRYVDLRIPVDREQLEIMRDRRQFPDLMIINRPAPGSIAAEYLEALGNGAASLITMRLRLEGKLMGNVTAVANERNRFSQHHAHLLSLLNDPWAIALTNSRRYQELVELKERLADDNRFLHGELRRRAKTEIIGAEMGLKEVFSLVRQVAPMSSPVLLLGETGSGKEIMARAIHQMSARAEGPFVKVDCGAIPDTLMDSELFGHEKGAFTGAHALKRGRFERAQGGTIFLDEIGELSPEAQVRLLRVLQDREVERVGGSGPIQVDIRVLAATHRALEAMVASGRFREDLYYRLRVFPVRIPPLRERRSDIPALVDYFIRKKCLDLGRPESPGLASGALDRILAHDWPGNVRELEHAVERELIIRQGALLMFADLESTALGPERADRLADSDDLDLDMVMARHIEQVLQRTNGRVEGERGAARLLGVNPGTLRYRMRKLGVPFGRKGRDR
ncbi:MAG: sigma-54 dependent transcriptional regulator [Proteobacteria bacterium]|nr:sigma-54 dependent transcriptional regulator [Pseudomonadota bacterium]